MDNLTNFLEELSILMQKYDACFDVLKEAHSVDFSISVPEPSTGLSSIQPVARFTGYIEVDYAKIRNLL